MSEFEDPSSLYVSSEPTGGVDDKGREIRTLGQPILALNPATNNLSVPDKYRPHSLLANRYFYTLPNEVIDALIAKLGADKFDAELLTMERKLAEICGDHTTDVGFWKNLVVPYRELRPLPIASFSDELVRSVGLEPGKVNHAIRVSQERDVPLLERFSRGYCGWLMTNQLFLDEHDQLLSDHAETIRRWGTQHAATFLPASYRAELLPGTDPNMDPMWPAFVEECDQFLIRWRLSGLAGPYLPIPTKPLMAGTFPTSEFRRLMASGGVFFLPDTMPVPSRDQLRGMLEDALHKGEKPKHLTEWHKIVRGNNVAKNQMDPFVRYLELQHYWKILYERHADAVQRNKGKLEQAFGEILGVKTRQIHLDMIEIRNRLGRDWMDRPWPLNQSDGTETHTRVPR